MPWVNLSAPAVGDPTEQPFAADIVGNLQFLYNQFLNVVGNREQILNGSFESDADNDGSPDGWVKSAFTGGTFLWDESTVAGDGKAWHGKRSAKWTSPGGGGNGGGTLTSEDFFEISEGRPYRIQFATKASVADVHNTVAIVWYDSTQTIISTSTFHDDAATNPTSWTVYDYVLEPPVNTRYAKLVFTACKDDDVTAGSTWWDDIRILGYVPAFERRVQFDTTGSFEFKVPTGVTWCAVICVGAGGGGGGSNTTVGAGGGGGGGMAWDIQRLTAGTSYAFTIGAGGAGGAVGDNNGSAGGNSTFVGTATLTANGGAGGVRASAGGTGGAGGSASGGRTNTTGETGATRSGTTGGDGGPQPAFGGHGSGRTSGNTGGDSPGYGGGGGGGGDGNGPDTGGGNGADGLVLILF